MSGLELENTESVQRLRDMYRFYAHSGKSEVLHIAKNPHIPPDLIDTIIENEDEEVLGELVANPACTMKQLMLIYYKDGTHVRIRFYAHAHVPDILKEGLAVTETDPIVLKWLKTLGTENIKQLLIINNL